jgi:2-octaprenyl-6-methoxyphenol hydroxylase
MDNSIAIIGGGPVGAIFALLNKSQASKIVLLESNSQIQTKRDKRALALSNGTKFILEKIDVWKDLEGRLTPIKTIHTSQKGTFGRSLMKAEDFDQQALGYIISYGELIQALQKKILNSKNIEALYNSEVISFVSSGKKQKIIFKYKSQEKSLNCDLLVLADGGGAEINGINIIRTNKSFEHSALVTHIETDIPHSNVAYERFTNMGPMALLPNLNGQYSLVWTGPTDEITRLKQLNNSEFLIALQQQFGDRVGNFKLFEKRVTFPLKQSFVSKYPESNIAIIGNSAQIMHPVAGQGLNTGVRDALILADCINKNVNLDFKLMINKFNHMRKKETKDTLRFTESLVILFSNDFIGVNKIRGMALSFLDLIPPIRKSFVRKMSYGK